MVKFPSGVKKKFIDASYLLSHLFIKPKDSASRNNPIHLKEKKKLVFLKNKTLY